jgi:hypothetical protein
MSQITFLLWKAFVKTAGILLTAMTAFQAYLDVYVQTTFHVQLLNELNLSLGLSAIAVILALTFYTEGMVGERLHYERSK